MPSCFVSAKLCMRTSWPTLRQPCSHATFAGFPQTERVKSCARSGSPARVDVIGVSCYSSRDLVTWRNEGAPTAWKQGVVDANTGTIYGRAQAPKARACAVGGGTWVTSITLCPAWTGLRAASACMPRAWAARQQPQTSFRPWPGIPCGVHGSLAALQVVLSAPAILRVGVVLRAGTHADLAPHRVVERPKVWWQTGPCMLPACIAPRYFKEVVLTM